MTAMVDHFLCLACYNTVNPAKPVGPSEEERYTRPHLTACCRCHDSFKAGVVVAALADNLPCLGRHAALA